MTEKNRTLVGFDQLRKLAIQFKNPEFRTAFISNLDGGSEYSDFDLAYLLLYVFEQYEEGAAAVLSPEVFASVLKRRSKNRQVFVPVE